MANNAKHPQITLLLTRPQRGSDAFWRALPVSLRDQLTPIISPLVRIDPIANDLPNINSAIFTSANGPILGPNGNNRIAYCVGAQTTQAARNAGWDARHLGNTADQLVDQIIELAPSGPLTHLCGTHTRGDVAPRLSMAGIETTQIAIYDQALQPLSDQAIAALDRENPVILPLFSPRTARQFKKQLNEGVTLHLIALSPAVAHEILEKNTKPVHICAEPTRKAMIEAVQNVAASIPLG